MPPQFMFHRVIDIVCPALHYEFDYYITPKKGWDDMYDIYLDARSKWGNWQLHSYCYNILTTKNTSSYISVLLMLQLYNSKISP